MPDANRAGLDWRAGLDEKERAVLFLTLAQVPQKQILKELRSRLGGKHTQPSVSRALKRARKKLGIGDPNRSQRRAQNKLARFMRAMVSQTLAGKEVWTSDAFR